MTNCVIMIPARWQSTRFPGKPLASIQGKPMVQHAYESARRADIGPVYVVTDHQDIADVITNIGGQVLMTKPNLPTGSDRVFAAAQALPEQPEVIINLQGDLPFVEAHHLTGVMQPLEQGFDVGTLLCPLSTEKQQDPHTVKAIASKTPSGMMQCHWFARAALPYGYQHLGVYAYKPQSLARFGQLPQHPLELLESLEQLRVLTAGMTLGAYLQDEQLQEVNVIADLEGFA